MRVVACAAAVGLSLLALASPSFAFQQKDTQGRDLGVLSDVGPRAPKAEAEAEAKRVWDAVLLTCGGATYEGLGGGKVAIEMQNVSFMIVPTVVTQADRDNGYEYLGTAVARADRWRWRSADTAGGQPKWRDWRPGRNLEVQPEPFTAVRRLAIVPDTVLSFDLIKRNGVWAPTYPISLINSETKTFDPADLAARPFAASKQAVAFMGPTAPPRCAQVAAR